MPRQGEVWLSYFPGQPQDPHQPRPALVVSEDGRNSSRQHAMVVPCFSAGRPGPTRVVLAAGMGGLPHDSVLFCEEIATVDYYFFGQGPLGPPVPEYVLDQVGRAVRRAMGEVIDFA